MAEPLLSAEGVGHAWAAGRWLFRGLDLAIEPGTVTAILGPNGRGKTTLLKALVGLVALREGRVRRANHPGYVPQGQGEGFPYTLLDMVLMGRARQVPFLAQPGRRDSAAAFAALESLGLADLASHPFDRLSGGERQLGLLARALAGESRILVLDEPASALDLANQLRLLGLLERLRGQGLAVVFTTHQPDHALDLADQTVLMLPAGRHRVGPTRALVTDEGLEDLYGVPVRVVELDLGGVPVRRAIALPHR